VVIAGFLMASYTMAGGLFSIAYVDVPQVSSQATSALATS
jgi:Na+/proline symporter